MGKRRGYGAETSAYIGTQSDILSAVRLSPEPIPGGTLSEYGVIVEDTAGTWALTPADEFAMIEAGVSKTALALQAQFGGATPQDAFRRVMIATGSTRIIFNTNGTSGTYCETSSPFANVQAQITCYNGNILSEYTVVHELGHVFSKRFATSASSGTPGNAGAYFNAIDLIPLSTNPGVLNDSRGLTVMGQFPSGQGTNQWVRGRRGWGSPASTPPAVPCSFQQNALVFHDYDMPTAMPGATAVSPSEARTYEREEAGADMFLNWAYSKINQGGFLNADWSTIYACSALVPPTPTMAGTVTPYDPGDTRSRFMNTNGMPSLVTRIPTMTPTP